MMRTTLLIGGAGLIGTQLGSTLLERGHRVRVLDQQLPEAGRRIEHIEYLQGDRENSGLLIEAMRNVDYVVDLAYAGIARADVADLLAPMQKNVPPTLRMLEAATNACVKKVVLLSSGGTVYGNPLQVPITEEHPTNPVSAYGVAKLIIEKYALMWHHLHQTPVVIARPANAYSERQRPFAGQGFIATAIASVMMGKKIEIFGDGHTVRDYIHVADIADGLVALLEHGEVGQVYNLGTGVGLSNNEIIDLIRPLANAHNLQLLVERIPSRNVDVSVNVLDINKAFRVTGWVPKIKFSDGLRQVWNYHAENISPIV
jgi:UDP-glucose 4-epimerase